MNEDTKFATVLAVYVAISTAAWLLFPESKYRWLLVGMAAGVVFGMFLQRYRGGLEWYHGRS